MVEFAVVVPLMVVLVVAIADFGRVFGALSATESAAREAADYGGFLGSAKWAASLAPWATNSTEMQRRALAPLSPQPGYCDAATQAHNPSDPCALNPIVRWELLGWDRTTNTYTDVTHEPSTDCGPRLGLVDPCVVHVNVTFRFRPIIPLPQLLSILGGGDATGGQTITLVRDSWFAISDLAGS